MLAPEVAAGASRVAGADASAQVDAPGPAAASATEAPSPDGIDLRLAQAGDPVALGRFFDRHFDRVYAIARRVVRSVDAAEDITQEVFLKVRRSLHRIRTDEDVSGWLYTVTVNACRDHLRSGWWRLGRRSVPVEEVPELRTPPGWADEPESAWRRAEASRRVHAALQRLPEEQRISVVLHEFEGLSHETIARLSGTSHAAARKRHSRALRALATLLREEAP